MQAETLFAGVDVAKAELVIAKTDASPQLTIRNEPTAIGRWLRSLAPGSCIAMESTGRYYLELATRAAQAGMKVYVLNARDVHFYAKGLGKRGKTDATDALVIARYVCEHHEQLHTWTPGTRTQLRLLELLRRRALIERHLSAINDSLEEVADLTRQRAALARYGSKLLATVDGKIQTLIDSDAGMKAKQQLLQTITGIGPQISTVLTVLLSRISFANVNALVAYSGLDPRPNDSGTKRGRRSLTKRGPAGLRKMMWLAAFAASHSKVYGPVYRAIKSRGFSGTAALVILARKLLRVAWAVWRTDQPFDAEKARLMT